MGNPAMIDAYKKGVPDNGEPFPDGAKMAKIHWIPKKQETYPGQPTVPGTLHDIDFMMKDSRRFSDTGGWGWAEFDYDSASDTFKPLGTGASCGYQCHSSVKRRITFSPRTERGERGTGSSPLPSVRADRAMSEVGQKRKGSE
jgi:hypothetical protein